MGLHQWTIVWRLMVISVLVRRCDLQPSDTCSVPCELGFSCHSDGFSEPRCIPMRVYLNLMQQQQTQSQGRSGMFPPRQDPRFGLDMRPQRVGPHWRPPGHSPASTVRDGPGRFWDFPGIGRVPGDIRMRQVPGAMVPTVRNMVSPIGHSDSRRFQSRVGSFESTQDSAGFSDAQRFSSETGSFRNTQDFPDFPNTQRLSNGIGSFRNAPDSPGSPNVRRFPEDVNVFADTPPFREAQSTSPGRERQVHVREPGPNVRETSVVADQSTLRVFIDPNTGERFALVPLDQQTGTDTLHARPSIPGHSQNTPFTGQNGFSTGNQRFGTGSQTVRDTGTGRRSPARVKQVPAANPFENQLPDSNGDTANQISSASIFKQNLSPVGSLSNNRSRSVLDIIEEFIRPPDQRSIVQVVTVKPVTVRSRVQTPANTTTHRVQTAGQISAILRDDDGYHFMFYPQPGDGPIRVNITKTGFCLRNPPATPGGRCNIWCSSDEQCSDNLKCCPNGCGLICTPIRTVT